MTSTANNVDISRYGMVFAYRNRLVWQTELCVVQNSNSRPSANQAKLGEPRRGSRGGRASVYHLVSRLKYTLRFLYIVIKENTFPAGTLFTQQKPLQSQHQKIIIGSYYMNARFLGAITTGWMRPFVPRTN